MGTHNLTNVINLLNQSEDWGPVTEIVDEIDEMPTEAPSIRESEFSAWLTIQIGCNNSCTFCIVPSVRGAEISRRPSDIINEAKSMIDSGVKEITLLGQNVNSYGRDLRIDNKARPYFAQLLYKLNELDGLERIRFTSPHPKDFKKETLEAVNDLEKVCKQVHVPLQSGSSKVLSKMQRGYTKEKFLEKIELVKNTVDNVSLTSDVIVGFPGETEDDFLDTLEVLMTSEFDSIFMFQFSPRPGTRAYDMKEDFIEKDIITDRFNRLKEMQTDISHKRFKRFIGTKQKVLVEKTSKKNSEIFTGKIDGGHITHLDKSNISIGDYINVEIKEATPFYLKAESIN